jgi:hypothetical protein
MLKQPTFVTKTTEEEVTNSTSTTTTTQPKKKVTRVPRAKKNTNTAISSTVNEIGDTNINISITPCPIQETNISNDIISFGASDCNSGSDNYPDNIHIEPHNTSSHNRNDNSDTNSDGNNSDSEDNKHKNNSNTTTTTIKISNINPNDNSDNENEDENNDEGSLYKKKIINYDILLPFILINMHASSRSNILALLHTTLISCIEGRCISNGFIKPDSVKIINFTCGKIVQKNVQFNLEVECLVCNPVENSIIDCVAKNITQAGIRAVSSDEHSPIVVYITRDYHTQSPNSYFNSIKEGDTIKVKIIGKRFEMNDKFIQIIGEIVTPKKEKQTLKKKPAIIIDGTLTTTTTTTMTTGTVPKPVKAQKAAKEPKATKEPKAPKEPKVPKEPKATKKQKITSNIDS